MGTRGAGRWAIGAAWGWLLAGCAGLGHPGAELVVRTPLPPLTAAWIAADVARLTLPGADPLPQHAGAPALRTAPDAFTIRYARAAGGAFRVDMNGRLIPPAADAPAAPRFAPAVQRTTAIGSGGGRIEIAVAACGSGAELRVRGVDAPFAELAAHLHRALALVEGPRGPAAGDRELRPCCAQHGAGLAQLLLARGRQALRAGQWNAARSCLARALAYDDQLVAARIELADLDARLARAGDEARGLLALAAGGGQHALRARARLAQSLRRDAAPDQAGRRARRADELLLAGDAEAALRWGRWARAVGAESTALRATLARIHRHRDEPREAMEFALEELADRGASAELVLALCDDALRMGDAHQALRLLARHWPRLAHEHRPPARARLRRGVAPLGVAMAARIFMSTGTDPQARELLAEWAAADGPDAAGPAALSRLPGLRASVTELAAPSWQLRPASADRSYELAPGVMPPR